MKYVWKLLIFAEIISFTIGERFFFRLRISLSESVRSVLSKFLRFISSLPFVLFSYSALFILRREGRRSGKKRWQSDGRRMKTSSWSKIPIPFSSPLPLAVSPPLLMRKFQNLSYLASDWKSGCCCYPCPASWRFCCTTLEPHKNNMP